MNNAIDTKLKAERFLKDGWVFRKMGRRWYLKMSNKHVYLPVTIAVARECGIIA